MSFCPTSEVCPGTSSARAEDNESLVSVGLECEFATSEDSSHLDKAQELQLLEVVTHAVAGLQLDWGTRAPQML